MPMNDEVRKAVEIDYAPGELDRTAPERVWLQIDTDGRNSERDDPWPGDDGVSWCSEPIGGLEVQYIRADLLRAELTRLTEIADAVDPLVVRLGEVTTELEGANAEVARLNDLIEPKLSELHYDAGGLRAALDGGACKAIAESFAEQFSSSGALNYLDVSFTASDGTSFLVTVQKRANPTAHELRRVAESKLEAANALLRNIAGCQWFNREAPATVELIDAHLSESGHD